jgi:hypothetical protein
MAEEERKVEGGQEREEKRGSMVRRGKINKTRGVDKVVCVCLFALFCVVLFS